jgi:spore germination protein
VRFRPLLAALVALTITTLALGVLPATTAVAGAGASPPPRTYVTGWLPYWLPSTATDSVTSHASVFDDASPFVFDVQSASSIDLQISAAEWQSMRSRLRQAGVDIIPTMATQLTADEFAAILSSRSRRAAHVDTLVSLANRYHVDGLDLDYESINFGSESAKQTVRKLYPVLLQQLHKRLAARGRVLSVTVAARTSLSDPNWSVYNYKALGAAADRVRIMTYDFHWSGGSAGPIAPKWWVEDVVSFATTQIPSRKVSFGLPAYGRDWFVKSVSGRCPSAARTTLSGSTRDLQDLATSRGINPRWSARGTSRTFTYTKKYSAGGRTCRAKRAVWFDDARSVAEKIRLVQQYQLRGVAMWALGYESDATWNKLRSYGETIAIRQPAVSVKAPATVVVGHSASVSAIVRDAGRPVRDKSVTLQRRAVGATAWTNVATRRTDSTGHVRFSVKPHHRVEWRVRTNRDWKFAAKTTSPITTRVHVAAG